MMKEILFSSGITCHLLVLILRFTLTLNDILFPFFALHTLWTFTTSFFPFTYFIESLNLHMEGWDFCLVAFNLSSHCYARRPGISTR